MRRLRILYILIGVILILFLLFIPKLFELYQKTFKLNNWCANYHVFNLDNLPVHKVSFFDKDIADGFDLPLLTYNKEKKSYKVFEQDEIDMKKKLNFLLTGEEFTTSFNSAPADITTIGKGTVVYSDNCGGLQGNVVIILHKYIENGDIKQILSVYTNLKDVLVKKNDNIARYQKIGTFVKDENNLSMHFEIRKESIFILPVYFDPIINGKNSEWIKTNYENPLEFIRERTKLVMPSDEKFLIIVNKHNYTLETFSSGQRLKTYEIAISQEEGKKMNEGDNRIPEGEYRICQMFKGPFTEKDANGSGLFLGTRWLGLGYPNKYDAQSALKRGLIKPTEYDSIIKAIERNLMPPNDTYLGGGIGIHGWNGTWPEDLKDITWGCISMKQNDLEEIYDQVKSGTIVIIENNK